MLTAKDGVTLTVTTTASTVAAGGNVTIILSLGNDRSTPLVYAVGQCGEVGSLTVTVPLPLDPPGKTWTGVEAWFKDRALSSGQAGGGVPATAPLAEYVRASPCPEVPPPNFEATLAPGATVSSTFTWSAEIIPGLDALAGPVQFVASAGFDRQNGPPSYPPDYNGPLGSWFPVYRQVAMDGAIEVAHGSQAPLSIGQAVDGLLADSKFTAWLRSQPAGTCEQLNVLPTSGQGGSIFKPGPNWEIDLFCETGVPRHWAIAGVDPFTAEVRSLTFCNVPCDR